MSQRENNIPNNSKSEFLSVYKAAFRQYNFKVSPKRYYNKTQNNLFSYIMGTLNMDISKIIVDNFVNLIRHLIERYIGRYIFRKTILIYQYKERLKEIVDDFTGVLSGYNRTYSLFQIIRQVTLSDSTKKIQIEDTRRMVELLEKWYSAFKDRIDKIDFFDLKYIYQTFNEFITILYETHTIFYSFFELIKEDNKIKNNLKSDISGYLKFEEIYNQTTKKFKELCKEASKDLKGEFKELNFNPLPKL